MKNFIILLIGGVLLFSCGHNENDMKYQILKQIKERKAKEDNPSVLQMDTALFKKQTKPVVISPSDDEIFNKEEDTWYKLGHVEGDKFVISDDLYIISKSYDGFFSDGPDRIYNVVYKGKEVKMLWRLHSQHTTMKGLITTLEWLYEDRCDRESKKTIKSFSYEE